MKRFIKFMAMVALFAAATASVQAQVVSYTADLPNPGWLRSAEYAVASTNFTIAINPTNLTTKEAWILVGLQTKMNVGGTNAWTASITPCNFEVTPVTAGLSTYNLGVLGTDTNGVETVKTLSNFPPLRAGDVLTLKGSGSTVVATNTTILLWYYRIMPYRNSYGLPAI